MKPGCYCPECTKYIKATPSGAGYFCAFCDMTFAIQQIENEPQRDPDADDADVSALQLHKS